MFSPSILNDGDISLIEARIQEDFVMKSTSLPNLSTGVSVSPNGMDRNLGKSPNSRLVPQPRTLPTPAPRQVDDDDIGNQIFVDRILYLTHLVCMNIDVDCVRDLS